ncbi:hypothetical protein JL09_g1179 [Pichia kudriavzevii]|uniref:Uncharacterized protein n=1 Tax=Pichia kudriavzevii TaxID=4909 RepID=A0A099P3W0_PICKU|nr:hypothetical protein JL09_g1179 [Pichia kudriavzevii]
MSREGFVPPSASNLGNAASGIQSIKNYGVKYVCAQCAVNFTLSPKEPVRCKECGHRVLYKARTKRMVQFEAQKLRILPLLAHQDSKQLPEPPQRNAEIVNYVFQLGKLNDFELTQSNQNKKKEILESFYENITLLRGIDNPNKDIIKSMILHKVVGFSPGYNELIESVGFDSDMVYLVALRYFLNPDKLGKIGRVNQLVSYLIKHSKVISEQDWTFLNKLTKQNVLSLTIENVHLSPYLQKLVDIVENVDACYYKFDLVGMLQHLNKAQNGYELESSGGRNVFVKYFVGYYRYCIIERALMEWNINSVTTSTWNKYRLGAQWKLVWDTYYNSGNIEPPGGASIKKKVQNIISVS